MTQATATDTRGAIISAAFACFRDVGLQKTTIVDIARAADLSRSTFYEYFRDKETIVEACAEAASQRFYRNMAKAIDRDGGSTLEDKLVRAAVFVRRRARSSSPRHTSMRRSQSHVDQECGNAACGVRRVPRPYVSAARLTGEVRNTLDIYSDGMVRANVVLAVHYSIAEHRYARR